MNTRVINSRPHKKRPSVWRRRQCSRCKTIFTTIERPAPTSKVQVWRPDGSKTSFNIGRLTVSIAMAFSHDLETGKNQALELAHTVEEILLTDHTVLTTGDIEAVTHQTLKRFDELAAIQYAAKHQLIVSVKRGRGRPSIVSPEQRNQQSPYR